MKSIFSTILFLVITNCSYSQKNNNFYLEYWVQGLGANGMLPFHKSQLSIQGNYLTCTYSNVIIKKRRNKEAKEFEKHSIVLESSSLDSLINVINFLGDTTIYRTNLCVMSGGVNHLNLSNGNKKVSFNLYNTFDPFAVIIANILNRYLPEKCQIKYNKNFMEEEKQCLKYLDRIKDSISRNN